MKYRLSIVFCLWASCAWAFPPGFIGALAQGEAAVSQEYNVVYHNEMASVTDPHSPTVGVSTSVYGSPSVSGGGVDFDAPTKAFKLNSVNWNEGSGTVIVSFRPHFTGWATGGDYYLFCNSGINLYVRITTSAIQFRYGSADLFYFVNTSIVAGQQVTFRFTWKISAANVILNLYINENPAPVATITTPQIELTSSPENIFIGDYTNSGALYAHSIIDDFKILDTDVTP